MFGKRTLFACSQSKTEKNRLCATQMQWKIKTKQRLILKGKFAGKLI